MEKTYRVVLLSFLTPIYPGEGAGASTEAAGTGAAGGEAISSPALASPSPSQSLETAVARPSMSWWHKKACSNRVRLGRPYCTRPPPPGPRAPARTHPTARARRSSHKPEIHRVDLAQHTLGHGMIT
jgi:hypothetical protein